MKLLAATLAACLLALPAWAAGPLDALRANSRAAREQVSALKAEQLKQRSELSVLSSRIETLKAETKGKLLPGGELDAALKRSQELSGVLSELAQRSTGLEAELETANLALLEGLSGELARLRADFDRQTDRARRQALIDQMRRVRAEREALRQTLPAAKLPTLGAVKPSDDPEELLEQADLLRDNEEKVRRELKALEARIAERREEAELDRRMQRFMGEESMFDDGDRRLRVQRTTTTPSSLSTFTSNPPREEPNVGSAGTAPPAVPVNDSSGTTEVTAGAGGPLGAASSFGSPQAAPAPAPGALGAEARGDSATGGYDSSGVRVTNASDARPQVGGARSLASGGGDGDLDDLEVERLRLQGLAEQLKKKAAEFQQRAADLR
jgi:hypothetical protein